MHITFSEALLSCAVNYRFTRLRGRGISDWAAEAQKPDRWQQLASAGSLAGFLVKLLTPEVGPTCFTGCKILRHKVYETSLDDFLYCKANTCLHVKSYQCGSIKQCQQDGIPSSSTQPISLNAPQLCQLWGTFWGMDIWRRTRGPQGRN